jgi:alkanesulfonate monooxygenase SsuD/methylene tetrahydromethanopterin reductase-like flavin-dependent oxidoreductase (luciferase family)
LTSPTEIGNVYYHKGGDPQMEFGVQIEPQFGYSFADISAIADIALKNGFSTIWFSDHFMLDKDSVDRMLIDPWLLMAALTQQNTKVRVGSMVFCQSYRNPALTAKMAASLDVLSNGRLEFGLGAGWKEIEYKAYGYPFPSSKTRISQLEDAVQIIKGIWTQERFTFKGDYYQVEDVISFPKPIQDPMPIWIGAPSGKEQILRVAAKVGDGINIAWTATPEDLNQKYKQLAKYAKKYGRDVDRIMKSVGLWTRHFESDDALETAIAENARSRNLPPEEYRNRMSQALWGTSEYMISRLREFEQLDISHIILMFPHREEIAQITSLGKSVLPKLCSSS